jgi:NADPH-dependent glutamate synthase beta subunit-like oxidoreductase/Pyruvate/2-oxoacid:ferredoxin oxidoreductase delta subunit
VKEQPDLLQRDFEAESTRITPAYRPKQIEKTAPCQVGCANCGDIRGWIGTIAQRKKTGLSRDEAYTKAWHMITDVNPFPSALGRICPHPCEDHCNRSELDEPLAINAMERFLGDFAIEKKVPLARLDENSKDEWLGVVGAGPSGLSFAYQMARRGYRVSVYEGKENAGGMLRYGVPDYRLPQDVLDAEIEKILDLGVELNLNTAIGRDITLEQLRERHAALYLGIGAQQGLGLGLPGEEGPSVWTGIDYLSRLNRGEQIDLGASVIVIGGGNTAVDAARSARRSGAQVTILYRRTRDEMPAVEHEIDNALEEGIELVFLVAPVRVKRFANGKLASLVVCRMELGEPDSSGRRRPVTVPDSEYTITTDALIVAVSQLPMLEGLDALNRDGNWLITDAFGTVGKGMLAGGDVLGLGVAGKAIVQGRQAAEELHARFSGVRQARPEDGRPEIGPEQVKFGYKPETPAVLSPKLSGKLRIKMGTAEVVRTISEKQFLTETERCYSCGSCFGCEQCFMYCTTGCFTKVEEASQGVYFTLTLDQCHECGKCIEVCPCGFLEVS